MNFSRFFKSARRASSCLTALLGMLLLALPITAHSMIAGKAAFVLGKVEAITADGNRRTLSKGSEISSGETISTDAGARAQIRFNDGGFISLQPNSLFRVDEFNYQNKTDGEEKSFFSLLKGGLRAITGAIGRVNRDSYRVATPVATIGVRGTGYSAELSEGLLVNVGEGAISLTNNAGLLVVSSGKAAYVATLNTLPAFTTRQPQNPPQDMDTSDEPAEDEPAEEKPAEDRPAEYERAEYERAEDKLAEYERTEYERTEYKFAEYGLAEYGPDDFIAPPLYTEADRRNPDGTIAPDLVGGQGYDMAYAYMDCGSNPCVPSVGEATGVVPTFGPSGELIGYVSTTVMGAVGRGTGTVDLTVSGTDGGFVSWGRWTGTAIEPTGPLGTPSVNPGVFDYVMGLPTVDMPLSGTATYVLISNTPPSATDNTTWVLNSASLTADFLSSKVFVSLTVGGALIAGSNYAIVTQPVAITGTTFSSGTTPLGVTGSVGLCGLGCTASINGFFAGSKADRAGLAYSINDAGSGSVIPPLTVQGVAAFAAPPPAM